MSWIKDTEQRDIAGDSQKVVGTEEMGDLVVKALES